MTCFNIRYFDNQHIPYVYTVHAKDIRHAITQFNELMPGHHMTSVLPAEQWNDE